MWLIAFITGSSLISHSTIGGGWDLPDVQFRFSTSPIWYCLSSPVMCGPSRGRSIYIYMMWWSSSGCWLCRSWTSRWNDGVTAKNSVKNEMQSVRYVKQHEKEKINMKLVLGQSSVCEYTYISKYMVELSMIFNQPPLIKDWWVKRGRIRNHR